MANEGASSPNIPADNAGSNSYDEPASEMPPANISEATAGVGSWDQQEDSSGQQPLDDALFDSSSGFNGEGFLGLFSNYLFPLYPGSQQHPAISVTSFVQNSSNETFLFDNSQGHSLERQDLPHQYTYAISLGTLIDPSLSTTAVDPSVLTLSTAMLADASENVAGESHHTDEPDIGPPSIQPPPLPHDAGIQLQPAAESGRHISNDVISMDEPRSHPSKCPECQKDITGFRSDSRKRHIDEHKLGAYPCPHPQCKKSKEPFKRPDKLKRHLKKTCTPERRLRETGPSS